MQWLERYSTTLLVVILAFAFFTRMFQLHQPETYVFDEVYHAVTAKLIARHDPWAYEWWNPPVEPNTAVDWLHPPLAKLTQASSMLLLGENPIGWRMSSVIFGVGVIWLTYAVAERLFKNKSISLLSAFLAACDGLLLVQSRVAMNDIHVTFFILLTLWLYLAYRQQRSLKRVVLVGLAAGLAVSSKWSGLFIIGGVVILELLQSIKVPALRWTLPKFLLAVILIPAMIYVASYSQMFIQGKAPSHLQELHRQIWWYQTNLSATHSYQSRPWQWFLNLRPVWYSVQYQENGLRGNIYALGNPLLLWLGAASAIGTVGYLGWNWKNRTLRNTPVMQSLMIAVIMYAVVWLPWQLSPRIMFFYHYTPAVPLLCILLAYWLVRLAGYKPWQTWSAPVAAALVCLIFATFWLFYPHWTGIAVPVSFAEQWYFLLNSWK